MIALEKIILKRVNNLHNFKKGEKIFYPIANPIEKIPIVKILWKNKMLIFHRNQLYQTERKIKSNRIDRPISYKDVWNCNLLNNYYVKANKIFKNNRDQCPIRFQKLIFNHL